MRLLSNPEILYQFGRLLSRSISKDVSPFRVLVSARSPPVFRLGRPSRPRPARYVLITASLNSIRQVHDAGVKVDLDDAVRGTHKSW